MQEQAQLEWGEPLGGSSPCLLGSGADEPIVSDQGIKLSSAVVRFTCLIHCSDKSLDFYELAPKRKKTFSYILPLHFMCGVSGEVLATSHLNGGSCTVSIF